MTYDAVLRLCQRTAAEIRGIRSRWYSRRYRYAVGKPPGPDGAGGQDFVEKLKGMKIKGSAKDQPSYRMIQSIDAESANQESSGLFRAK
jgi:hypothetical protein